MEEITAGPWGVGGVVPGGSVTGAEAYLLTSYDEVLLQVGDCSVLWDSEMSMGVVAAPGDVVQVHLIANEVVRTTDDLGVGSTVDEILSVHGPSAQLIDGGEAGAAGDYVALQIFEDPESLSGVSPERTIVFDVNADGRVVVWRVGVASFVLDLSLCPDGEG